MRELARIAEAVYAAGTFDKVSAPKKIPARRKQMVEKTQGQASVGVIG